MFLIELVKTLQEAKIKFAVAGGYAVALHGAIRGTVDIDIVIATTLESYQKAEAALLSLGFPILSKKSLIAMKRAAGRPQDLEDIAALERLDEKD